MRILFLAHRVPYPPNKGDKIRSFNEIRHLSGRHEVWLGCLADDPADLVHLDTLRGLCREVACEPIGKRAARARSLGRLVRGGPMSLGYFYSRRLARTVNGWLGSTKFDVVLAFSSSMAQYVWPERPGSQPPRVMDLVDVDSEKFSAYARKGGPGMARGLPTRWGYATEAKRLARYEAEIAAQFDRVILVSEAERAVFERVTAGARRRQDALPPLAVPNGVDTAYFAPGDEKPWPGTIVFAGAMDYRPNVDAVTWLVREVLPRARARLAGTFAGNLRLRIVGARPTRAVRRLARADSVEVIGTVPDIRPYVRTAAVSVAPMRVARGVQNKILEAMAMGVPVVTTSAGLEGLSCRPAHDVLVADDADAMAEAISRVLRDPDLARDLRERGRAYTTARHPWDRSMQMLEEALVHVAERARPRPQKERPAAPSVRRGPRQGAAT